MARGYAAIPDQERSGVRAEWVAVFIFEHVNGSRFPLEFSGNKSLIESKDPGHVPIKYHMPERQQRRLLYPRRPVIGSRHIERVRWQGRGGTLILCHNNFGRVLDGTPFCGRVPGLVARVQESDRKIKLYVRESPDRLRHLLLRQALGVLDAMQFLLRPELPYVNFHRSIRLPLGSPYPFTAKVCFTFRKTVNGVNRLPVKQRDGSEVELDANALVGRDVDIIFVLLHRHLGFGRAIAVAHILQIVLV
ncbi:hypothetical protein BDN72DRAFT_862435 [Pluteus cervinus]|uniref:Uncharacterized protein n=1 Tax=Pluteus cervinus TaxID=181527 RepID=A0ACD3AC32_9AGAR|nr:hypothetical protein BDN72DRAFT_862435 [Pluteus cervinus]